MFRWLQTTALVCAVTAIPLGLGAETAPTVFAPADAPELRALGQTIETQSIDAVTARRIALVVVDDASRRTDGTLEQIQADQALVLQLAKLAGDDPEIMAIHANLVGVEAGIEEDLIRVLTLAKASSRALDRLARDNPGIGGTYMQRGLNALHSPPIAGRIQIAINDFERLSSGDFDLSEAGRAEVQLLLAQSYLKAGQQGAAEPLLATVVQADVPRWSETAKTILAGL